VGTCRVPAATAKKTVFVSAPTYTPGDLGGLSGADVTCQSIAQAAGLSGTFAAWLSDDTTDAASRLTHASVPYALPSGTLIATDWDDLTSGTLRHAIDENEKGQTALANVNTLVVTSTTPAGKKFAGPWPWGTCDSWTSTSAPTQPIFGGWTFTDGSWTDEFFMFYDGGVPPSYDGGIPSDAGNSLCGFPGSLYCIEQ